MSLWEVYAIRVDCDIYTRPGQPVARAACGSLSGSIRLLPKYRMYLCISREILYQLYTLKVEVRLTDLRRIV